MAVVIAWITVVSTYAAMLDMNETLLSKQAPDLCNISATIGLKVQGLPSHFAQELVKVVFIQDMAFHSQGKSHIKHRKCTFGQRFNIHHIKPKLR